VAPSIAQIGRALEGLFVLEDLHNIGPDYDPTLMAWWANFDRTYSEISHRYDRRFYLMWKFYLLAAAGAARARDGQLYQIVISKTGRGAARLPRDLSAVGARWRRGGAGEPPGTGSRGAARHWR